MTVESTPTIRRASLSDAALLAELGERTFRDTFAEQNTPEDMAIYLSEAFGPEKQTSELADSGVTFLIAEVMGIAAGYVKLERSKPPSCMTGKKPIELARIYVLQEWLGKRIGEVLMNSAIAEAKNAGHETIWLGVWERNERAIKFYKKRGFVVVGTHLFQLGSDAQTDLLMERSLLDSTSEAETKR